MNARERHITGGKNLLDEDEQSRVCREFIWSTDLQNAAVALTNVG
jgi:hypothetical protein